MQDASPDRPTRMKLLPVGIALIAIPLIPALILVILVRAQEPWHSRPIRSPVGQGRLRAALSLSARRPLPTLADHPLPDLKIQDSGKGIEITGSKVPVSHDEHFHELFFADANGTATLPDGTRLTLEAIALLLPRTGRG